MGNIVHKAKSGALLTGTNYEASDAHTITLTAADVGADASGAAAAAQAAAATDATTKANTAQSTAIAAIPALATTTAAVGTSAGGSATTTSKGDHVHATGAGTPSTQAFGDAAATGAGPAAAMTDHKHAMPANPVAYAAPALTLGTSNSAGVAASAVRTDATILAFDATVPAAIGTAAVGAATVAARRDHVHPTGAGTPTTIAVGDAAATGSGPTAAMTDHKHGSPATYTATAHHTSHETAGSDRVTSVDVNDGAFRMVAGTTALATNEGTMRWDTTHRVLYVYDSVRERGISDSGFLPYAYTNGANATNNATNLTALAANGGTAAAPITLDAPMIAQSWSWRNGDTTLTRSIEISLFEDQLGNSASLTRLTAFDATDSFTAAAASTRTKNITTPATVLPPGTYWVVIRNTQVSNTYSLGGQASGTMALNGFETKTLGSSIQGASTLDLSTSWARATGICMIRLNGRVFAEAAAF